MIATLPFSRLSRESHHVNLEQWARTRELPGWERDRIVWAKSIQIEQHGFEIVKGVFAPGWRLSSRLWEFCLMISLSEYNGNVTCCPASDLSEGQEGCHALILLIDTRNAPQISFFNRRTVNDIPTEALLRHLWKLCSRDPETGIARELTEKLIKRIHLLTHLDSSHCCSPLLHQITRYVSDNIHRCLERNELADAIGISEGHLSRRIRSETGFTLSRFVLETRLLHARELLWSHHEMTIKSIWQACGFESETHFYTSFRQSLGMTPGNYRNARFS